MDWCKLHGRYYNDGAIVAVGEDGEVLFVRSLAWSSDNDTQGFIPSWQLERFGLRGIQRRVAKLVNEGLWTIVEGGWQITNYEKWQAELTSAEKRRRADRLRKQSRRRAEKSADTSARKSAESRPDASRISPVVVNGRVENRESRDENSTSVDLHSFPPLQREPLIDPPFDATAAGARWSS